MIKYVRNDETMRKMYPGCCLVFCGCCFAKRGYLLEFLVDALFVKVID